MNRLLLAALATVLPSTAWAQNLDPEPLVVEALASSPSVAALRHREDALRQRAAVLGSWPDPVVSVEYSNAPIDRWTLSAHPMSGLQLRVQQRLRPARWSAKSRAVGTLRADVGAEVAAEAELQLALAVRTVWWALVRTRALEQLTEEHLRRTNELLRAIRSRYETGAVGQHAVLRLQVLRDGLQDELGDFVRRVVELEAALDEALSTRGADGYPTPLQVDALPPPPDEVDWLALAVVHRPHLTGLDAEVELYEQAARLARSEALPDLQVWAGYRIRSVVTPTDAGTDFVSIGLGLPIPLGSGRRAAGERDAALAEARAARSRYRAGQDEIRAAMASILAAWRRAHDKASTYDASLIPGARSAVETTRSDFTVGRADFASLFEAEVALIDVERARIAAAVETHIQLAEATAVLGVAPTGDTP